ncbi:unnamed protein product [Ceratitis capitata]|uniref:(Mediterranean fruit fly) hypothetical protein n=1 Tax=Ceratitis capitata TaxID=7213 RepID=A0A811U5F9_CERCA|nr:unnamed protein product [Ceratitis capitata]
MIFILIFIFGLQTVHIAAAFTQKDCKTLSVHSKCQCYPELLRYEITCVTNKTQSKFNIRISPRSIVKINCEDVDVRDFDAMLPSLKIGRTKILQIQNCPLPVEEQSVAELLTRLEIEHVNYLAYTIAIGSANITHHQLSGMEQLQNLKLNAKTEMFLPNDLFQHLPNLIWLNLRSNNLTLEEHLLEPLVNLTYLDLGHNFLVDLPAGIFKNQGKLRQLNLWNNRLRKLTNQAFQGAHELSFLDLSSNEIEHLEHDVFAGLVSLKSLNLNMNKLVHLPADLFASNKLLKEFRLINNKVQLKTLPSGLFENLTLLEEVTVTCGLVDLQEDLFDGCTKLANLTLRNNELTTLPDKLLSHQKNLYNLDLSHNRLQSLPDKLFQSTVRLVVLKLSHNQLVEITSELFKPLTKLEILQLNDNDLFKIDFNAFTETSNMKYLNLANNQIDFSDSLVIDALEMMKNDDNNDGVLEDFPNVFTSPFRSLFNLQELSLRNNSIMYLYKEWRMQLPMLRTIDLSYNKINTFSTRDVQFVSDQITLVNLTHNLIEQIDFKGIDNIEQHIAARHIHFDLNYNPLRCDCGIFHFAQYVGGKQKSTLDNKVEISAKNLRCQSPPALENRKLIQLNGMELVCPLDEQFAMEKQCPRNCACWLRPVDQMLLVNCSNRNLTEVPTLPTVKEAKGIKLDVSNNRIASLPSVNSTGYATVVALQAANNRLRHINVENLPKNLEHLDVRYNLLHNFDEKVVDFLNNRINNLQLIYLAHNPWACDCAAKTFIEFMQTLSERNEVTIHDMSHMRCTLNATKIANTTKQRTFNDIDTIFLCKIQINLVLIGLLTIIAFHLAIIAFCYNRIKLKSTPSYSVFLSYSEFDDMEMIETALCFLNQHPVRMVLTSRRRNFNTSQPLVEQFGDAIRKSKRIIIILTENFLKDVWNDKELGLAHRTMLASVLKRTIIIVQGNIRKLKNMDPEFFEFFEGVMWFDWDEPFLWEKVRITFPNGEIDKGTHQTVKTNLTPREICKLRTSCCTLQMYTHPSIPSNTKWKTIKIMNKVVTKRLVLSLAALRLVSPLPSMDEYNSDNLSLSSKFQRLEEDWKLLQG